MSVTKVLTAALGFVILSSPRGSFVCEYYVDQPRIWGFTALNDQQAVGAVMMLEEAIVITAAFGFMFMRMLTQADAEDERTDRDAAARPASDRRLAGHSR